MDARIRSAPITSKIHAPIPHDQPYVPSTSPSFPPLTYKHQIILPKSQGPPLAKRTKLAPGAEASISVTLKSLRNPPLDITLPSLPLSTSILNLKESLSTQSSIPVAALRVLYNKKPVADSKTLKDVLGDGEQGGKGKVEFGVMVIGGANAVKKEEKGDGEPMEGVIGKGGEVLKTEEFWEDLKGFLVQRLKDEGEGERVWGVFRGAIEKS
jgi:hypothetical protein